MEKPKTKLVLDADPGVDDAHAIMMALAYPHAEVIAITTVAGNVSLERTTTNALIVLDQMGKNVPVFPGCDDALVYPTPLRASSHGVVGLGNSEFPPPSRQAESEHAVMALIRLANEMLGELTLVALGPLTNVALATRLDPELPLKYKRLVVLGGAMYAKGNSYVPTAEYNFYIDPEAAAIVFGRWIEITLATWETAMKHALTREQFDALTAINSPRAEFFGRIFADRAAVQFQDVGVCYDPDPLAVALALEPEIARQDEHKFVSIELAGRATRGQSVVDWTGMNGRPPNTHLVGEVDRDRFFELMKLGLI
jgi:purine nucleosidase